jgi:predicted glycoside hydrolase/deacetylase ChbG (UPF0249 family)
MVGSLRRYLLNNLTRLLISALAVLTAVSLPGPFKSLPGSAWAQESKTLAERLGYAAGAKLLIVHADDLAVAHSVDAASTKALESGSVSSASIMVPCPWLTEIAGYAQAHPQADLGLHLTLTSEWALYRWGPVSVRDQVISLLGPDGYLYPTESAAAKSISPREAEIEVRAQIERARAFGINPTHLDSHMGTLFQTKELFQILVRAGHDYKLPFLASRDIARGGVFESSLGPDDILLDRVITITPAVTAEHWFEFYINAIKNLQPGVTELIIHLAYDDDEMRAITFNHPDWGAAWRKRDFDFFTSEQCRKLLEENHVRLITWREIGKLLQR